MKIAITGATGQLGRLVVNQLKEKVSADNISTCSFDTKSKRPGCGSKRSRLQQT